MISFAQKHVVVRKIVNLDVGRPVINLAAGLFLNQLDDGRHVLLGGLLARDAQELSFAEGEHDIGALVEIAEHFDDIPALVAVEA